MLKLAILFGGISSEHSVSCVSAASVLHHLDKTKYTVYAIGITREGRWFYYPDYKESYIQDGSWIREDTLIPAVLSPDRQTHGVWLLHDGQAENVHLDCVFPVLHGAGGEDGTIQGLLTLAGIPYVGCDTAASANAMDKSLTKILVNAAGIRQAKYALVQKQDFFRNPTAALTTVTETIPSYPMFVKPCSQGSSVGVTKATTREELQKGLQEAFTYDNKVLVEEFIDGHEIECAVLGNDNPIASTVGEIAPTQTFYTFDAKYHDESSQLYIPAHISEQQIETVRQTALRVYTALGCTGLSRVDFFCAYRDGEIVFNELNTIPGFTSISMYPKLFDAVGVGYTELLDRLITLAQEGKHG